MELVGQIIGKYTILSEVGEGGVATVYRAEHVETGEIVAVKILKPFLSGEQNFRARFEREARVLQALNHPNIVSVLDYGQENGTLYLVMPFMDVGTLGHRLASGPLKVREGASIIRQITAALQYAHDRGVVHRDVKPSNILLDDRGKAMLADFGFAHIGDTSISLTGSALIGTPAYMAPEYVHGSNVTPKADQYSLGVILYQMSTGQLPFDAPTPMAMAIQHATQPLPRPRAVNPKLPDSVEAVIIRALSKDPQKRYASITALSEAFQQAVDEAVDPVSGYLRPGAVGPEVDTAVLPPGTFPDESKESWPRRLRKQAWVLALLLLALLACPALAMAGSQFGWIGPPTDTATPLAEVVLNGDVTATWNMLRTQVATEIPQDDPSAMETAVAGTVMVLSALSDQNGAGTPTGTMIGDGTVTQTPTNTTTLAPGETRIPTFTNAAGIPTATNAPDKSPTSPPAATATQTSPPPPTSTPTSTVPPPPTSTMPPPPTATVNVCSGLGLGGFSANGQELSVAVYGGIETFTITRIYLDWPEPNKLKKIEYKGNEIWKGAHPNPPSDVSSGWSGDRSIAAGSDSTMVFFFEEDAASSPYLLRITVDNGCEFQRSN